MDECIESPEICGSNSDCGNTDGNYTCTCKDGYRSDNNDKNRETDCKGEIISPSFVYCVLTGRPYTMTIRMT